MSFGKYFRLIKRKNLSNYLNSGINIFLILILINFLSVNFVIVELSFTRLIVLYLIFAFLIINFPFKQIIDFIKNKKFQKKSNIKIVFGILIILLSFILLLFSKFQILWFVSIPLLISGLDTILKEFRIYKKEFFILSVFSFIYAIFFIIIQTIPSLWYIIQQFSLWFSKGVGILIGKPLFLGPSISGLWIIIVFLIFSVTLFFLTGLKKKYFILNKLGLLISWIIYIVILGFINFESNSDVVNYHLILFLICLISTYLFIIKNGLKYKLDKKIDISKINIKKLKKNGAIIALVLLFLSSITLTVFINANGTNNEDEEKKILFYGHNMLGGWNIPEYGSYGKTAAGMFGLLPYYLNLSGYDTKIVVENQEEFLNLFFPVHENITRYFNLTDYTTIIESSTITSELLSDFDIFVVINLNSSFSADEHKVIWDFVENGGSLLVLGDHTDIGGMMEPLNNLLEPVGISYRFDSGLPIRHDYYWPPSVNLMHHPVNFNVEKRDEIAISVGASLNISLGSYPIIQGKYGLSDIGDYSNIDSAFLGDYEYNPGEQIGDIVLTAGAYYGNGRVIVFGDTSSFQDTAIFDSYPFLINIFNFLGSSRTLSLEIIQISTSLILLIGTAIIYTKFTTKRIRFVFFPLILCFGLIISFAVNPIMLGEFEIKGNIAYIDVSHIERFNQEPFKDDSLSGFIINLMRNNYLPLKLTEFSTDKISYCEILILNAPTKTISDEEVDFIKQYIYNGGLVILTTGYQHKDASMPLLNEFNLDIYDIPLGPVPYVEENPEEYQKEPRFADSWPIYIGDSTNSESFYSITIDDEEYILMTFTEYGEGGLLFISDSDFLKDSNLESLYDYWPGNIQYLKNILDEMITRGVLQ